MEELIQFAQANVQYAHFIIFGLLLLAGFNIPVSEDAMIFISALLASNHKTQLPHLFTGVYLGAYFSDLICYWLGRLLGPKLFEIKFFSNMMSTERREKIHAFYERYGIVTLIVGRFIPFGVRNGLFLTAGLGKMNFLKFSMADLLACTISTVTFFTLYFHYGNTVIEYVKKGNIIIFGVAAAIVGVIYFRKKKSQSENA